MTIRYPVENIFGETVEPTGHIRERIAAAIAAAKPSLYSREKHVDVRLRDPIGYFLIQHSRGMRDFREEWADNLLAALDGLGLAIVESDQSLETAS